MPGETDLELMLATLTVSRRPGTFTVATTTGSIPSTGIEAIIAESEGTTMVCAEEAAVSHGWEHHGVFAWLTLDVHSSLDAVGLTAAVSRTLADHDIPCNVLAGYHHDHLLVPIDRADEATRLLTAGRDG